MSGLAYYNEIEPFAASWLANLADAKLITNGHIDTRSIADVQPADLAGYERCHFFAGIAGWDYALQLAGWPAGVPVWTGSCPCQPFSAAGKRKGVNDERHLWPEFFRLIRECRPYVVFGEQVASAEVVGTQQEAAFVVAVQNGDYARANKLAKQLAASSGFHYFARWVDRVQADMAAIDYTFRFKVLGAHSVKANHKRQRLYWVAYDKRTRWQESSTRPKEQAAQQLKSGRCGMGIADIAGLQTRHKAAACDGHWHPAIPTRWSDFYVIMCRDEQYRRISSEPGDEPLAYGVPAKLGPCFAGLDRVGQRTARANRVGRLRAYGNAIVPQVAAVFIRAFMECVQ